MQLTGFDYFIKSWKYYSFMMASIFLLIGIILLIMDADGLKALSLFDVISIITLLLLSILIGLYDGAFIGRKSVEYSRAISIQERNEFYKQIKPALNRHQATCFFLIVAICAVGIFGLEIGFFMGLPFFLFYSASIISERKVFSARTASGL